jgi:hypothetical protein
MYFESFESMETKKNKVKILPGFLLLLIDLSDVRCPSGFHVVVNGSLDLTARAIVLQAFVFDLAKIDVCSDR